jgi:hypothetical protein
VFNLRPTERGTSTGRLSGPRGAALGVVLGGPMGLVRALGHLPGFRVRRGAARVPRTRGQDGGRLRPGAVTGLLGRFGDHRDCSVSAGWRVPVADSIRGTRARRSPDRGCVRRPDVRLPRVPSLWSGDRRLRGDGRGHGGGDRQFANAAERFGQGALRHDTARPPGQLFSPS